MGSERMNGSDNSFRSPKIAKIKNEFKIFAMFSQISKNKIFSSFFSDFFKCVRILARPEISHIDPDWALEL